MVQNRFKKYIGEHAWDNAEFTSIVPSDDDEDEDDYTCIFKRQNCILDCELHQLTLERAKSIAECLEEMLQGAEGDYCLAPSQLVAVTL